ncbi:hypothetical protein T310_8843, partial [Rasamsonia emersonii CBS 393.64]
AASMSSTMDPEQDKRRRILYVYYSTENCMCCTQYVRTLPRGPHRVLRTLRPVHVMTKPRLKAGQTDYSSLMQGIYYSAIVYGNKWRTPCSEQLQ